MEKTKHIFNTVSNVPLIRTNFNGVLKSPQNGAQMVETKSKFIAADDDEDFVVFEVVAGDGVLNSQADLSTVARIPRWIVVAASLK